LADAALNAWVTRVLGVTFGASAAAPGTASHANPSEKIDRRAVWRDAKESVDDGLNRLASELRSYEDPDLERIADFGLFGLGTGENVALNKALIEYEAAAPDRRPAAGAKLRTALGNYRTLLQAEPMVRLIDRNPAVPMTIAATLGGALDQIERSLA